MRRFDQTIFQIFKIFFLRKQRYRPKSHIVGGNQPEIHPIPHPIDRKAVAGSMEVSVAAQLYRILLQQVKNLLSRLPVFSGVEHLLRPAGPGQKRVRMGAKKAAIEISHFFPSVFHL